MSDFDVVMILWPSKHTVSVVPLTIATTQLYNIIIIRWLALQKHIALFTNSISQVFPNVLKSPCIHHTYTHMYTHARMHAHTHTHQ